MRWIKWLSYLGLVLTILPAFLVIAGRMSFDTYLEVMLVGSLLYLLTAPWWINRKGV
ncbi:MAG: hypothetical protein AAF433_11055 [Bacteroidota bacterium]